MDLCSVALIIPSAPSKPHYTHFPMDLPVHFFPMDLLIPGIFWERGASVIYGQLGFLGAWETLGSAGNRQLPMFAWKKGEIGVKQGTAAASKGLKPWKKEGFYPSAARPAFPLLG